MAEFDNLIAYVAPECPDILGEIYEDVLTEDVPMAGLVVRPAEGRSWGFRPFGQSIVVRKHRVMRSYLRSNAWKIEAGMLSRKAVKKAARRFAERAVADDACAGCKCAVRSGDRTWLAVL